MPTLRKIIVARFKKSGMTRNELATRLRGKVSRSSVYDYLDGGRDLSSTATSHVLTALKLEVRPKE